MRPRAWRITMWTTLAATVLLVGGAIGSKGWMGYLPDGNGRLIAVGGGELIWGFLSRTRGRHWTSARIDMPAEWWSYQVLSNGDWTMSISLWLPAGATFAVSSLSAFMVHRTRRRPGHCPKCGYSRSGLPTDAPCPECGRA